MPSEYRLSAEALQEKTKIPLKLLGDSGEVYYELALDMLSEVQRHNEAGKSTVLIVPVGPTGQYPIFVRLVNQARISLANCWFFNMDEYLQTESRPIDPHDPLSFHGFMEREVYSQIDPALTVPPSQRIFPDPADPAAYDRLLEGLGGADLCIGGIGINGHVAFNEPQPELSQTAFSALPTRVRAISPETLTANAIGSLGGALEAMPRLCVTAGMRAIVNAKAIRLGVFRDWHRAVLRRAACGEISTAFPVSLLQQHPNTMIYANANAAKQPY